MKKIYNVMASAAVIASLAIPASAFASSSYNTPTGVISTQANTVINTASTQRVQITIAGGSMSNTGVLGNAASVAPATANVGNTGTGLPTTTGTYTKSNRSHVVL